MKGDVYLHTLLLRAVGSNLLGMQVLTFQGSPGVVALEQRAHAFVFWPLDGLM